MKICGCFIRPENPAIYVAWAWLLSTPCTAREPPTRQSADVAETGFQLIERSITIPVADADDVQFARLSANSGLSQDRVSHIVQDDQGFMWFGTQYGLNRFDGYKFKVFTHDPKRPESLGGVYIKALFKDHRGNLWIACDQVLDRFDPLTETFIHYWIPADSAGLQYVTIHNISEDSAEKLWLATDSGLYKLDPKSGRSIVFRHDPKDPFSLGSSNIKYVGSDAEGNFWIANDAGLDAFDRSTGHVTRHVSLPEIRELSFFEDRTGTFWIFHASGSGLATFDRKTNVLTHLAFSDREPFDGANLGISSMIEDNSGTLWLGTNGSGLFRLDRERNRFVRYKNHSGDGQSLASDAVVALFEDREGSIWVALHGVQVNVFSTHPLPFKKLTYGPPPSRSRGGTMVNAVYEDSEGSLWLSYVGMLAQIDRSTGNRGRITQAAGSTAADVLTMAEDSRGNVWFGTAGAGLSRLNLSSGMWREFHHNARVATSLSDDAVARVMIDHHGTLWAATFDGLDSYDEAANRFSRHSRVESPRSEHYLSMAEDAAGLFWLGSNDSGLQTFDPVTDRFEIFLHNPDRRDSLSNNRVNSVLVDHGQRIWIGTQDGLDVFDRKSGTFTAFYDSDGLAGNVVSCILEDQMGDLWMSTNKGISHFDPDSRRFSNFTVADGLPGSDLSGWGSCFKSKRGEMFFGGYAGATAFFPKTVADKVTPPSITLTEFDLRGMSVSIGNDSPLAKAIAYTEEVILSHMDSSFAVAFSSLSFRNAQSSRYRYRLDGLETQWREVDSDRRLASFTTLPAGKYMFEVQSAISSGPWSKPATLRITILPPWWATWWFRTIVIAAALVLLIALYYFRLGQLKRQIRQGLELRHAERERIARDLHDTLLQTIQGSKLVADGALDLDLPPQAKHSVQRLSQWLGRAMDEGRAALDSLRSFAVPTGELAESLRRAAEDSAPQAMKISLSASGDVRPLHAVARDEIYRIASEAVRNACAHSGGSQLTIQVKYARDLTISIQDDGSGFEPQMIVAGKPGHFGIAGMRERAAKIGARLSLRTSLGEGTELTLSIPGKVIYGRGGIGRQG